MLAYQCLREQPHRFIISLKTVGIGARTGRVAQAHTDLFVPSTIHFLGVTPKLYRSRQANIYNAEAASASNASGLCVGGCVWFAEVRATTKRGSRPKGACEAQVSFVKILRILSEIHSNFIQYTPP